MSENKKKQKNKKIISAVKVISFILTFVVLLEALSATAFSKSNATTYTNKYRHAYNYANEKENTIDIVALGNSNLYSSFCPVRLWDKQGYTGTVIASPRQTVSMSYSMLTEVLTTQSPKFVLLETDMFYEGVEFNPGSKDGKRKNRLPVIPYITDSQLTNDIQNHFSVFLLHDRWKKLSLKSENEYEKADVAHGYLFNKKIKKVTPNSNMDYTNDTEAMPEETVAYLNKMIDTCKNNGIRLLFFGAPSLTDWSYARHNAVDNFCKENGIDYLDFNTLEDYEINYDRDFRDKGNHMNYYGAKKITNYIGDFIKENYSDIIEDKRENSDFSYWYDNKEKFIENNKIKKF